MRKFLALILAVFVMTVTVCAKTPLIVDKAGLLSSSEVTALEELLDGYSTRHNLDIAILTSYETENGMSTIDYSEDFYVNNYGVGPNLDGVLFYINLSEREWQIVTSGKAINSLTDYGLEYIENRMIDDLSDGYYYDAFKSFADACDELLTIAENGEPYDVGNAGGDLTPGTSLLISLGFGLIVALISVTAMRSQLKSVGMQKSAANYIRRGSFNITQSRDIYLYRNVSRTARPRETSSSHHSGGSTVHRSSSGHSFGGRGGKF